MRFNIFIPLCLITCMSIANASPILLGKPMGLKRPAVEAEGFVVFLSMGASSTNYTATYEGSNQSSSFSNSVLSNKTDTDYTLREYKQSIDVLNPLFGLQYRFAKNLRFTLGLGASVISLDQEQDSKEEQNNDLLNTAKTDATTFKKYNLNPGVAFSAGVDWEILSLNHLSFVSGLYISYLSASGLDGLDFNARQVTTNNSTVNPALVSGFTRTTDVNLSLFAIQPYAGLEWRPMQTFISNTFGIYANTVFSHATFTQKSANPQSNGDNQVNNSEISFSISPDQILGVYYGWYFSILRFGTLGIEGKAGSILSANISYQYEF